MLRFYPFNMKTFHLLLFPLLLCSSTVSAQYQKATAEQKNEIIGKMQASGNINTMQCDFTQVKEISILEDRSTSEGKMFYKKTNKIRWEYTKPVHFGFSKDGKNMYALSGDKTATIPANQRKMFDGIGQIMISGVSGAGLFNSSDFDTEFFVGSNDNKLVLVPKNKEVKDLYSSIQLYVSKPESRIHSIELVEKSGDKTTITLKNIQVNIALNDGIFSE